MRVIARLACATFLVLSVAAVAQTEPSLLIRTWITGSE